MWADDEDDEKILTRIFYDFFHIILCLCYNYKFFIESWIFFIFLYIWVGSFDFTIFKMSDDKELLTQNLYMYFFFHIKLYLYYNCKFFKVWSYISVFFFVFGSDLLVHHFWNARCSRRRRWESFNSNFLSTYFYIVFYLFII